MSTRTRLRRLLSLYHRKGIKSVEVTKKGWIIVTTDKGKCIYQYGK